MNEQRTISPILLTQHPGLECLNKQVRILDLVGRVPDRVISDLTGLTSRERVRQYRELLGIRSETRGSMRDIPDEILSRLGKMTDVDIAKEAEIQNGRITALRNKLKILPVPHTRGPRCKYPWDDIMRDWNSGDKVPAKELAIKYNIKNPGVIYSYIARTRARTPARDKNTENEAV